MKQKKNKIQKIGFKLSIYSMIAAIVFVIGMLAVPTTSMANAIHYLRPYQVTNGWAYDGKAGESFAMAGTKYTHGVASTQSYGNMHAVFNLKEEVSSVSFTLGHLDNNRENGATFYVYLDEVLQEDYTKALTYDMMIQTVTINTQGKKQLKIIIEGNYARYGMGNIKMLSGHSYNEEVVKVATVKDAGLIKYTCRDCGSSYQEKVPARAYCLDYLSPYQTLNMYEYKEELGSTNHVGCMGEKKYRCLQTTHSYGDANALYSLNGNYSNVSFMVGHKDNDETRAATMNIYVDGIKIKQEDLYFDMSSKLITIDTSNVTQLKIEVAGNYARYVIYDFVATPKNPTVKQHSFVDEVLTEAAFGVSGVIRHKCSVCGAFYTSVSEPKTRNMTDSGIKASLAKTNYVYNGKFRNPAVEVTYEGTKLVKGQDYAVSYENNKNAGTAKAIVKGLGFYKGQISLKFTIQPQKTNISSIKNKKKGKAVVKWKKNSQADGYQIKYSQNRYFSGSKTKNVSKKTSYTLTKLRKGYTYYVKIRPYKKSGSKKIYGDYGKVKKIYIKK